MPAMLQRVAAPGGSVAEYTAGSLAVDMAAADTAEGMGAAGMEAATCRRDALGADGAARQTHSYTHPAQKHDTSI